MDKESLVEESGEETGIFVNFLRPCLAEFVQVTVFVFIGTISVKNAEGDIVGIALAHGLTIALLIAGFGSISGGHINPAVTLGVALSGGIKPLLAVFYFVAQMLGGLLGAAFCRGVLGNTIYLAINGGGHTLNSEVNGAEGVLCETIVTSVLVLTVLLTAVDTDGKNPAAPFAIGLAVLVDILAAGKLSGASMNPARSFGPCVVLSPLKSIWTDQWVYWVGPLLGSLLAVAEYRFFFGRSDKRVFQACC